MKRTECRFGALTLCINIGILYLKLFNHPDRQRCIDAEVSYISETEFRIGRVRSYFYVILLQILRGCHIAGSFYFAHDNIINDLLIQIQAHRPKGIEICQICFHAVGQGKCRYLCGADPRYDQIYQGHFKDKIRTASRDRLF